MQIQDGLHKREEYLNFTLWLFSHRLFFFCLFHSLNYIKSNISDIFLPSSSRKFGDNVPNRVKRNEHVVFIHRRFIQKAHAFTQAKKRTPHV